MNRSSESAVESAANGPAPKSISPESSGEETCRPSRSLVSNAAQAQIPSDTLALPKGKTLNEQVFAAKSHEDFVVPIPQAVKDVSPTPKKVRQKPDLLRHLSDDAILPFEDSSDHQDQKRIVRRRHSDSGRGSGGFAHSTRSRQGSLDSSSRSNNTEGDDDNTTQSSNYNSFATEGSPSDGNLAGRSDESSHEEELASSIPRSIPGEAFGETHAYSSSSSSAASKPSMRRGEQRSSPEIRHLTVAMSTTSISPQRPLSQTVHSAPTLSTIPQDTALEEEGDNEHERGHVLGQLAEDNVSMISMTMDSMSSMPSLSSIHWDDVSPHQRRSMHSVASMSSSSSDVKQSGEVVHDDHSTGSLSSSEHHVAQMAQEGKAGTKEDSLNPVISNKGTRRTSWDRISGSGQNDSPPSSIIRRSIEGEMVSGPPHAAATVELPVGSSSENTKRRSFPGDAAPSTPRIKNPKKSSKEIVSAVKAIVGPLDEMSLPSSSFQGNDTIPRAARRRSSGGGSSSKK